MTARSLPDYTGRNLRRVVSQNKKLTIISSILMMLGIPLAVGAVMVQLITTSNAIGGSSMSLFSGAVGTGFYVSIAFTCLSAAVFMGMFVAIVSFSELWSKQRVDMLYALPLTGKQRFLGDYLGGACMYLVPYIVSVALGWILLLTLSIPVNFADMSITRSEFLQQTCKYYALATFGLLALMLLYYTLQTLVTACCGTMFENIYTGLLLNLLIPGALALILFVITNNVNGLSFGYSWDIIGYTSPIGGLIYLIYTLLLDSRLSTVTYSKVYMSETSSHAMLPTYFRWIAVIVVLSALLFALAWFLYTRRKAEHVGKTFVYVGIYYVMLTLVIICILTMMDAGIYGPALLFSAIVYFIMEVIRKRGFRRFWLSAITYVSTVVICVGCFVVIKTTDCFGRAYHVPASATVSSVRIDMGDDIYPYGTLSLEYTDRDVIEAVERFHRGLVADQRAGISHTEAINRYMTEKAYRNLYFDGDAFTVGEMHSDLYWAKLHGYADDVEDYDDYSHYTYGSSFSVTYYTIAGTAVHRSYSISPDELTALTEILQGTDLYAEAYGEWLSYRLLPHSDVYSDDAVYDPDKFLMLDLQPARDVYSPQSLRVDQPKRRVSALKDAYTSDLKAMTTEDFRTSSIIWFIEDFPIYEACTETTALLEEWGAKRPTLSARYDLCDADNPDGYVDLLAIRIYAPGSAMIPSEQYPHCTTPYNDQAYVLPDGKSNPLYEDFYTAPNGTIEEAYPELAALLDAAQAAYLTEEDCYLMIVGDEWYTIPPEDAALAEAVIDKGSHYYYDSIWGYVFESGGYDYKYYDDPYFVG